MFSEKFRILLVDDDEDDAFIIEGMLSEIQRVRFQMEWASTYETGLNHLNRNHWSAALVDYDLGMKNGLELIREAASREIKVPMIMVTGRGRYEVDLDAMQAGAADYIAKDQLNSSFLERTIRYAIEHKRVEEELEKGVADRTKELRASEALLSGLFNAAPDAILLVLADGTIQRANQQAEQVFGYPVSKLAGAKVEHLLPNRFRDFHVQHRAGYNVSSRRRPMGLDLDLFGLHQDGHEFPVDVTLSPLDVNDQTYVICVVRDLSNR